MSDTGNNQSQPCVTCGQPVTGKFCGSCGEKVLHPHDRTIGHFFHEFLHGLTHADGKFLKSLRYLFSRPGFLTKEYITGRRKLYSSPLSLFFIANIIYLMIPFIDALNSSYVAQVKGQPYSASIQQVTAKKMQQRKWTLPQMEEQYNHKTSKVSKVMLILLVFLFSLPVAIIFYNKKLYYADHLAFATEFLNFVILGVLYLLPLLIGLTFYFLRSAFHLRVGFNLSSTGMYIALAVCWLFLTTAAARIYNQRWYITLPKTLVLILSFAVCVVVYRYILFHTVMWLL
jgi:hypothetical protein